MAGKEPNADKKPSWWRKKFGAADSREPSPRRSQAPLPGLTEQKSSEDPLRGTSPASTNVPVPLSTEPPLEDHAGIASKGKDPEPELDPPKPVVKLSDGSTVWKAAYERLKTNFPELVAPYEYLIESSAPGPKDLQRAMSDIVGDSLKALESKQWKPKFRGKSVDVRGVLDEILKLIQVAMPVASPAGSLDPVHAGLPLAGVGVLLNLLSNDSGEQNAAMDGAKTITNMIIRYRAVEDDYIGKTKLFGKEFQDEFLKMRTDLYFRILEYQAKAACYFGKNTISRFFRNIPKLDGWQDLLKGIQTMDKQCAEYAQVFDTKYHRHGMESIQEKLDEALLKLRREDELNEKILSWVSNTEDITVDHNRIGEKLTDSYKGSGSWLFSHPKYQAWGSSQNKETSMLFLRGPAGTGKSSLAFQVAESHLKEQATLEGHGLAIFYCSRKALGSRERTAIEILRSLIAQLSWSADYMNVPKALKDAYSKAHASSVTLNPHDEIWRDIFAQLLTSFTRTTIILDALDECLEHESLLGHLRKTHDEVSKLHIFATCRLDVDVATFFPAFVDVQLSDYTQEDVSFYIRNEIRNRVSIFNDGKHADLQNQLITELEAKAQGMFQWVKLELVFFTTAKTRTTVLKKLNDLRDSAHIPKLDTLYEKILRFNIGSQEDEDGTGKDEEPTNEYELELAMRALQLVFVARMPLRLKDLVEAISINECGEFDNDENLTPTLLSKLCANLLMSDAWGKVEFTHLSVRDWLTKRENSNTEGPHFSFLELAHVHATKTSLLYLQHLESLNSYHSSHSRVYTAGFQSYAEVYWPTHYSSLSSDKRKHHLLEFVKEFIFTKNGLTNAFRTWSKTGVLVLASCLDLCELLEAQRDAIGLDSNEELNYGNYGIRKSGRNALHLAAEYGSDDTIDFLLAANTRCTSGLTGGFGFEQPTALMTAIQYNHEEIALKLIPYTPLYLLSETNSGGETALIMAEKKKFTRAVAALLELLPKEGIVRED